MERFVRWVIRRRWAILAACLLLSAVSFASMSRGVIATSVGQIFLGENPQFAAYLDASRRFGSDEVIIVALDEPEVLAPAGREKLREAIARVEALPDVERVESVLDAKRLEPGPDPFGPPRVVRYADEATDSESARAVLAALAAHPQLGGVLAGRDGRSASVLVHLVVDAQRSAEALPRIVRDVNAAFEATYAAETVHLVGFPVVTAEMLSQTVSALALTTPIVGLVLLATVWLLFRRIWPAALSLVVAGVGVVWTMGLAVAIDPHVNMLTAAVPAIMLIIAFSDVVHLCSAYLLELDELGDKDAAIIAACSEVGRACVFTSITTGVGFLCLSLIPTPAFRILGVVLGCGVGLALLLAVTLTPILFHVLPAPKPLRRGATANAQAAIDRVLAAMQTLATGRPKLVVAAFALASVVAAAAASRLEIETDFNKRLAASNPVSIDQAWFDARFVGSSLVHVFVDAPGELTDPTWFRALAELQERCAELPGVERAASWVDLVAQVFRVTPAGRRGGAPPLPPDDAALELLLRMVVAGQDPALARLVDPERRRVRILVNVEGQGMRSAGNVARKIEAIGAEVLGPDQVVATGLKPLLGQWLDTIVRAQRDGIGVSALIIALVMVIGLRSLRVGLGSMPPNLFPLLVVVACLGAFWDKVDSDCIALTFVALGIGVDDTIHFLSRLRLESLRGEPQDAIARTFAFAGRAIFMTTTILVAGFLPFLLSDYFLMRLFGSMLPLCMVVALLADLLLVPAMAQLGWLRFE